MIKFDQNEHEIKMDIKYSYNITYLVSTISLKIMTSFLLLNVL